MPERKDPAVGQDWMEECDGLGHFAGVSFLIFALIPPRSANRTEYCIALFTHPASL
jgi:hypothetical protein